MEREVSVAGDILLELREADELDCISLEENSPLSITEIYGGIWTLLCC